MSKGKKTSTEKRVNVTTAKIGNPDLSLRDIGKTENLPTSTVKDILDEGLEEVRTSSEKAKTLYEINLEIINDGAKKVGKAIKTMDPKDIRDAKEMQSIVETAFKQNLLLDGKATDIKKLDFSDLKNITTEELLDTIKSSL